MPEIVWIILSIVVIVAIGIVVLSAVLLGPKDPE